MNLSGFGQAANSALQGANAATTANINDQNLQQLIAQAQAQSKLTQILQALGNQQGQRPQPAPNPILPTAMPQTGGVSPSAGGAMPMGGASGGMGPAPAQSMTPPQGNPIQALNLPQQGGMPGGITMQALAQAVGQSGLSPQAQGAALESLVKLMQPQANNALKLDLGAMRDATQQRGQDIGLEKTEEQIDARKEIAAAQNAIRQQGLSQPSKDRKFLALQQNVKSATAAYAAKPTQKNYDALTKASKDFNDYAGGSGTSPENKPDVLASPPSTSVPKIASNADYDKLPSGATFIDPEGTTRTKP